MVREARASVCACASRLAASFHAPRARARAHTRTQVVDPDTGGEKLDDIRTSFGTFLSRGETPVIAAVERRVAAWAQVPEQNAENLQILRRARARRVLWGRRRVCEALTHAAARCLRASQIRPGAEVQRPLGLVRQEDAGGAAVA